MSPRSPFSSKPKHEKVGYEGDFELWQPLASVAQAEAKGFASWVGPEVKPLKSRHSLTMRPLESYFGDLFSRVWKKASVSDRTSPQRDFLAQTRSPKPIPTPGGYARPSRGAYRPMVSPAKPPVQGLAYLDGIANDWRMIESLERISAYTFRGDGRDPDSMKAAGGFTPPSTRNDDGYLMGAVYKQFTSYLSRRMNRDITASVSPDDFLRIVRQTLQTPESKRLFVDYCIWRALMESEELHLGRMLAEEALKGYISTTRAMSVAKGFACNRKGSSGWVYMVLIRGGFVVPEKGKHKWTTVFGEQEIAMPGNVGWENVFGYRHAKDNLFDPDSPIALRTGFKAQEPKVFKKAYALFSGAPQP